MSEYKFEDGPFVFEDGKFYFWTIYRMPPAESDPEALKRLGTVRVRVGRFPGDAVDKKFGAYGYTYHIFVSNLESIARWLLKYPNKRLISPGKRLIKGP